MHSTVNGCPVAIYTNREKDILQALDIYEGNTYYRKESCEYKEQW